MEESAEALTIDFGATGGGGVVLKKMTTCNGKIKSKPEQYYHHVLLEPSHTIMVQACLSVLFHSDSNINKGSLKDFPLPQYASQYFGDHVEFGNVFAHIRDGSMTSLTQTSPMLLHGCGCAQANFDKALKRAGASPLYHIEGF